MAATNPKLKEMQKKAKELLKGAGSFNISDMKADKTMYFESPQTSTCNPFKSPFKPCEISARSTTVNKNFDSEFDEIMRTSVSADVRNKYRESLGMGRLSSLPQTADVSLRSTQSYADQQKPGDDSFWGPAKIYASSFKGQNLSIMSDEFKPAEEMSAKLRDDQYEQEQEYAPIPNQEVVAESSSWEDRQKKQPEMSFGAYCQPFLFNCKDVFGKEDSGVQNDRSAVVQGDREKTLDMCNSEDLQKWLRNIESTPEAKVQMMMNLKKQLGKTKSANLHDATVTKICKEMNSMDIENEENCGEKENIVDNHQEAPVKDTPDHLRGKPQVQAQLDPLLRDENTIPSRGIKRRSSLNANGTPKSTLDKCLRSKSPAQAEQKEAAAVMLKPRIDKNFKVPNSFMRSPTSYSQLRLDSSPSSREYYTAASINSSEKLSLPNYALHRPESSFSSPTSSVRAKMRMSPQEGLLKRTVSQLSTGSEFHDDILPLKIKKSHRKLSFESVKLNKKSTRTVTIQNKSTKKLPLRVKIQGSGFTVTPREDFRMTANEARSFEVEFSPSVVGPARGELTFELMTNSRCSISIPLFAYGGHAFMAFGGIQKAPIGPAFIPMGQFTNISSVMTQYLRLTNNGTIPQFGVLTFEKTKWSDINLCESLHMSPSEVHLMPGESKDVKIRFKATKDDIRKILNFGKETVIVGEIFVMYGDEATRMRMLKNKSVVLQKILEFLPEKSPFDDQIKEELLNFVESWDTSTFNTIAEKQLHTMEIALTVNRNMDETQFIAADFSMIEESTSFMTFCETKNSTLKEEDEDEQDDTTIRHDEYLESRYFRVIPAQIFFSRSSDRPNISKVITIESDCSFNLLTEAVSSKCELISAVKSCGILRPGESVEVKVTPTVNAFRNPYPSSAFVVLLIDNAKVEIPVKFVE